MDHLGFVVKDFTRTFRQLVARGARPVIGPGDTKGTKLCVADPYGIWMELCQATRDCRERRGSVLERGPPMPVATRL